MSETNYNLQGLKKVFWGLILQFIGQTLNSGTSNYESTSGSNAPGIVFSIVVIALMVASLILIVKGLNQLKDYSPQFSKAKRLYIAQIIITIVTAVMSGIAIGVVAVSNPPDYSKLILPITIFAIAMAATFVINLLFFKNLLTGCSDIALANDDMVSSKKFNRLWKLYVIFSCAEIVAVVITLIIALNIAISGNGSDETLGAIILSFIGLVLVLLAIAIAILVVFIMILVRIHKLYAQYNNVDSTIEA